jgi:uncharacterized cupin superfamily protein
MATVLKASQRKFEEEKGKLDGFRLCTDRSCAESGVRPKWLNFDLRQLNPGECSAPYHSHRYAEELFMMLSGSATLRTPDGLEEVGAGDLLFFEVNGAHQLYNHTDTPCTYLDIRTSIGFDVCDYPDSGKVFIDPSYEVFDKSTAVPYFEGETHIRDIWKKLLADKFPTE